MVPRHSVPADDLYARLELPVDATFEAVEIAWRSLLKRHHPDVAGERTLEVAKRINVAHDWLSDPDFRATYDAERHPGLRSAGHRLRRDRPDAWPPESKAPTPRRPTPLSDDPAEAFRRFTERVGRLSADELDRLSMADTRPIAFVATIRRFLSDAQRAAVAAAEAAVRSRLDPAAWTDTPTRDAILGYANELVLGAFLDELLTGPFRERTRERLARGWEAAIDQPRYGPNTPAARRFLARVAILTLSQLRTLADSGRPGQVRQPWPAGLDPEEDEAFRVSSALAARDAAASMPPGDLSRLAAGRARRALAQTAHAIVLRHAFTAAEFARLTAPWLAATGDPATGRSDEARPEPTVRRRG
jgi:curved DNA-binding protein CbpA